MSFSVRCQSLPHSLEKAHASYAISWQLENGVSTASELYGQCEFVLKSKPFQVTGGKEDIVQSMLSQELCRQHEKMYLDVQKCSQFTFRRKQVALTSGVLAIVFIRTGIASLAEIGFSNLRAAHHLFDTWSSDSEDSENFWNSKFEKLLPRTRSLHRIGSSRRASSMPSFRRLESSKSISTACTSFDDASEYSELGTSTDSEENITSPRCDSSFEQTSQHATSPSGSELLREQSPEPFCEQLQVPAPPSLGSVGHPECCSFPCKFAFKGRGCKEGANCKRCHICRWTRQSEFLLRQKRMLEQASNPQS